MLFAGILRMDKTEKITALEFEKNIFELESKIDALRQISSDKEIDVKEEISRLEEKIKAATKEVYANLNPWQKTLVARHPQRPHFSHYIKEIFMDFVLLKGDRLFAEDDAIIGGLARFNGRSVVIIGQEKGHDIETRIKHNFGMAKPEGYRKSQRLMDMADRFNLPIITFIDTAGAYPGQEAEERGQSEAIAKSIEKCLKVTVPIIAVVIGEGGSGGAIAIASANKVLMLEHSIYSVISPEGCASILWRDGAMAKQSAEALKLTAQDLLKLNIIDEIIKEPLGGAHRDYEKTICDTAKVIQKHLNELLKLKPKEILNKRREKFLNIGKISQ